MKIRKKVHSTQKELTLTNDKGILVAHSHKGVSTLDNWETIINNNGDTMYLFKKSYKESNNSYKYQISDASQVQVNMYKTLVNNKIQIYSQSVSSQISVRHNYDCSQFRIYNSHTLAAIINYKSTFVNKDFDIKIESEKNIELTYAVALVIARMMTDNTHKLGLETNGILLRQNG